jgi:hypothetical protein
MTEDFAKNRAIIIERSFEWLDSVSRPLPWVLYIEHIELRLEEFYNEFFSI